MKRPNRETLIPLVAILCLLGGIIIVSSARFSRSAEGTDAPAGAAENPSRPTGKLEHATFGGGCFWCTEAIYQELKGVYAVTSGYSGGKKENPTYEEVTTGFTGHAEVIQMEYDPEQVSYAELLKVFWKTHDPTTVNQQGADIGTQYRSVVFYHNDQQKQQAEEYRLKLDGSGAFGAPIVTEISPFSKFYAAEKYHQDYYSRNPELGYCRAVIGPKLEKFRRVFQNKLEGSVEDASASGPAAGEEEMDWSMVDWKSRLTPEQYKITRKAGTEKPHTNQYCDHKGDGEYRCVCCGLHLFLSSTKYDSGSGWPSFFKPVDDENVSEHADRKLFSVRTEIRCTRCDAHLGHVFEDGPLPTGLRYCTNSAALQFVAEEADQEKGD